MIEPGGWPSVIRPVCVWGEGHSCAQHDASRAAEGTPGVSHSRFASGEAAGAAPGRDPFGPVSWGVSDGSAAAPASAAISRGNRTPNTARPGASAAVEDPAGEGIRPLVPPGGHRLKPHASLRPYLKGMAVKRAVRGGPVVVPDGPSVEERLGTHRLSDAGTARAPHLPPTHPRSGYGASRAEGACSQPWHRAGVTHICEAAHPI